MKLAPAAAIAMLSVVPAAGESILDPLLGAPGDCYFRFYDETHLNEHPGQRVESIFIAHDEVFQDPAGELTLRFGFSTRNGRRYEGVGICEGNVCGVEGDRGAFTLTPYRDGLRLEVDPVRGMSAEGAKDFIDLSESDDKVFLLFPASPRACE